MDRLTTKEGRRIIDPLPYPMPFVTPGIEPSAPSIRIRGRSSARLLVYPAIPGLLLLVIYGLAALAFPTNGRHPPVPLSAKEAIAIGATALFTVAFLVGAVLAASTDRILRYDYASNQVVLEDDIWGCYAIERCRAT